jgi:hypothetical protein
MGTAELAAFGLTPDEWLGMSLESQLPYVFRFWAEKQAATHGEALVDAAHLLAANLLPARERPTSSTDYALTTKGEAYYDWNPQLDVNGDGQITIDDLAAWLTKTEARGGDDWASLVAGLNAAGGGSSTIAIVAKAAGTVVGLAVLAAAGWYAWERWA